LIEASATNLETGQPALDYCMTAFGAGMHVILANKGPIALAYDELIASANMAKRILRFEATVMAGTPSLALALDSLAGSTVLEARGILNGTTNYILTQMHQGQPYPEALAEAQRLGYAETDPRGDVEGWDAAGKLLILAATVFKTPLTMQDLQVTGITGLTTQDIIDAKDAGECYKLIAHITPQGGSVQPVRLPLSDPLASVSNALNAITLKTDVLGDVTLIGPGAGRRQTGFALLADLLAIHRMQGTLLD
jgi:homoserine dehydrogenase